MHRRPTFEIIKFSAIWIFFYGVIVFVALWSKSQLDINIHIVTVIDLCKAGSLVALIVAGGEIVKTDRLLNEGISSRFMSWVQVFNKLLIGLSVAIVALLMLKVLAFSTNALFDDTKLSEIGYWVYQQLSTWMIYFSMLPIFGYSILKRPT